MLEVNLEGCQISQLNFVNKLDNASRISLKTQYSYNLAHGKDGTCRGEFVAKIENENDPEKFRLKITVLGLFRTKPGVEKEILHVKSYDALFPHVKAIVASITANAGIPPLYIPYVDISNQEIYRMDMPVAENDDED